MKKKYTQTPKRITLKGLLLRALSIAAALSLLFGFFFWTLIQENLRKQIDDDLTFSCNHLQERIGSLTEETEDEADIMRNISVEMAMATCFTLYGTADPSLMDLNKPSNMIISGISPNCHAAAALVNRECEITASSRETMTALFYQKKKKDEVMKGGWYKCNHHVLQLPELDQLFEQYHLLRKQYLDLLLQDLDVWLEMEIDSAYIDRETHTFIPHHGRIKLYYNDDENYQPMVPESDQCTVLADQEFTVTTDDSKYELVEVTHGDSEDKLKYTSFNIYGTDEDYFNSRRSSFDYSHTQTTPLVQQYENHLIDFGRITPVYINRQPYNLHLRYTVDMHAEPIIRFFASGTAAVTFLLFLIALLWCWRKNTINKAKYAVEDQRRDLTNHLAHDIKTPLTAIGGYAENLLEGQLTAEEQQRYLRSILDNVAFTDTLINRTLYLNSMENSQKIPKEQLKAEAVLEEILRKYTPMLDEKGISYQIQGSAEILAERGAFEAILENLISNAVKYTPQSGKITAVIEKKQLTLTNTVAEKVDTRNLMTPFVRGDAARSNVKGSGLGLSIAERAAAANGMKLSVSCTDSKFTAELRF
ncbi:MAG: HAMP domain-containing histidine kinase [Oscillospiraceae bacterium]|nr:HAMP domain-containing histidine kinase [Oscillospiraceae bacterium]